MDNSTISFETWCKNHDDEHEAKWCRELYPWEVFQQINYDKSLINTRQHIIESGIDYFVQITDRFVGKNNRINYNIKLENFLPNRVLKWHHRKWNDLFYIVEDPGGYFITLYTEKKDPSKKIVKDFFNERFWEIQEVRSIPVSGLLFRSVISYAANDSIGGIRRYQSHPIESREIETKQKDFGLQGDEYSPFLSKERELWISFSFTEEKAHRLALRLSGQAKKIIVVYCHPTFTRHHRANDPSTQVVSLTEYIRMMSIESYRRYLQPAKFLINHLRVDEKVFYKSKKTNTKDLYERIFNQSGNIQIKTSELREAKAGLGISVTTRAEAAYVCACGNLINAVLSSNMSLYQGSIYLSKNVYAFKRILGLRIEEIISCYPEGVSVYIGNDDLVYITIMGIQFSFHAIPMSKALRKYLNSKTNKHQEWLGLRLQPISPLVLDWARCLLMEEAIY